MRPSYSQYDFPSKDIFEPKPEEAGETEHVKDSNKDQQQDSLTEESEIIKAVKEELEVSNILKGVAIREDSIDSKFGKALNKFIQLYAPNHIDSMLNPKTNLHNNS